VFIEGGDSFFGVAVKLQREVGWVADVVVFILVVSHATVKYIFSIKCQIFLNFNSFSSI
jgi:hypothetical protein